MSTSNTPTPDAKENILPAHEVVNALYPGPVPFHPVGTTESTDAEGASSATIRLDPNPFRGVAVHTDTQNADESTLSGHTFAVSDGAGSAVPGSTFARHNDAEDVTTPIMTQEHEPIGVVLSTENQVKRDEGDYSLKTGITSGHTSPSPSLSPQQQAAFQLNSFAMNGPPTERPIDPTVTSDPTTQHTWDGTQQKQDEHKTDGEGDKAGAHLTGEESDSPNERRDNSRTTLLGTLIDTLHSGANETYNWAVTNPMWSVPLAAYVTGLGVGACLHSKLTRQPEDRTMQDVCDAMSNVTSGVKDLGKVQHELVDWLSRLAGSSAA